MKFIKFVAWCTLALVLGVGAIAAVNWPSRTVWPQFPATKDGAPSVVVQREPDFSWRTGDSIPLTIFIKQAPHTRVDVYSLAAVGDFEKGQMRVFARETRDGTTYIRLDVTMQSMAVKPKLVFLGNMSYSTDGSNDSKTFNIGPVEFYTSPTWDGRPNIQEPAVTINQEFHWLITVGALLIGMAGFFTALVLLRRYSVTEPVAVKLTVWQESRRDFGFAWEKIALGDDSVENYKEIERIMRRLYHFETRTVSELDLVLGVQHPHLDQIRVIVGCCNKVLYQELALEMKDKLRMKAAFDEIMASKAKRAPSAATTAAAVAKPKPEGAARKGGKQTRR